MNTHYLAKPRTMMIFSFVMIFLAFISYHYIDKSVAEWGFYNSRVSDYHHIWQYATYLQPLYYILSPWFVFYVTFLIYFDKPVKPWHKVVLLMIFSMAITLFFNEQLRYLFGRHWPATWFHGNPSWIRDKAYGFTWFTGKHEFRSFPSGHTSLIFGFCMVLWWLRNDFKSRLFVSINCAAVPVGLLLMCYHFVSDVLIGALVGTLVSYVTVYKAHSLELFKDL